jgi:hypothetical protein
VLEWKWQCWVVNNFSGLCAMFTITTPYSKMLWRFDTQVERRFQNGNLKLLNWSHKLNLREGLYQPLLCSIKINWRGGSFKFVVN